MLRSTQSLLKHAAKLSRPCISPSTKAAPTTSSTFKVASRASSTSSTPDYDQIMRGTIGSHSFSTTSTADSDQATHASASPFSALSSMPGAATVATSSQTQIPSGMGATSPDSNCYRSVDEPTRCEDYDTYELHHPPCERTQVSHCDGSYVPSGGGGEMGFII